MLLSPATMLGLRMTGNYNSIFVNKYSLAIRVSCLKQLACSLIYIYIYIIIYIFDQHHILYTYMFITAKSFLELVKYLFGQPNVTSFLSQRTCQDPLENFFGCQRQRGGTHDNPNVQEFIHNTQALRVINSFCKGPARGNCRGSTAALDKENDGGPLPKRPRLCSKKAAK